MELWALSFPEAITLLGVSGRDCVLWAEGSLWSLTMGTGSKSSERENLNVAGIDELVDVAATADEEASGGFNSESTDLKTR